MLSKDVSNSNFLNKQLRDLSYISIKPKLDFNFHDLYRSREYLRTFSQLMQLLDIDP